MNDQEFLGILNQAQSEAEILTAFKERGVEMTTNKLLILIDEAQKALDTDNE
jgi:hypothetical protein